MISEPEMTDESGATVGTAYVLSGADHPPPGGSAGRRPWKWALGAALATSAIWAAALQATGYGHTPAPDLHGLHLSQSPCTSRDLQPLTGALGALDMSSAPAEVSRGPALDHLSCTLDASEDTNVGWAMTYTVTVTVDLHKKTDPRTEFETANHLAVTSLLSPEPEIGSDTGTGDAYLRVSDDGVTSRVPGLGDSAYLTSGRTRETLAVLRGGAVLSLIVDATSEWRGEVPPINPDGTPPRPALIDISALRPELPRTMRQLMTILSH